MNDWKPGDVVTATVKGRESVRLVAGWSKYEPRLRWCEMSPRWGDGDDDECWFVPSQVTDHRPLVAIDPEDREAVERLLVTYGRQFTDWTPETDTNVTRLQAALREYANPKPPRPDEPQGLGAVVEDEDGRKWVRADTDDIQWHRSASGDNDWREWRNIAAVRVLSPGVEVDQ